MTNQHTLPGTKPFRLYCVEGVGKKARWTEIGAAWPHRAPTDAARAQLAALGDLQRQIAGAGPAALTSLRGEIAAAVTISQALVQQGHSASPREAIEAALAAASARTRATVQRLAGDLFERRILDPHLQFASPEEDAYRRREGERRAVIERELAKGTPEGNLHAANVTVAQIEDAGAHGADRSPGYAAMLESAEQAEASLRAAAAQRSPVDQRPSNPSEPANEMRDDLNDVVAALRDAGVTTARTEQIEPTHGLAAGRTSAPARSV